MPRRCTSGSAPPACRSPGTRGPAGCRSVAMDPAAAASSRPRRCPRWKRPWARSSPCCRSARGRRSGRWRSSGTPPPTKAPLPRLAGEVFGLRRRAGAGTRRRGGRSRARRRVGVLGGFRREDRAGVLALARLPEVPAPGLQPRATAGPGRNRVRLPHAVREQFPGGRAALRRAEYPVEQLTQSALRKLLAVRELLPLTTDKEDQPTRRPDVITLADHAADAARPRLPRDPAGRSRNRFPGRAEDRAPAELGNLHPAPLAVPQHGVRAERAVCDAGRGQPAQADQQADLEGLLLLGDKMRAHLAELPAPVRFEQRG